MSTRHHYYDRRERGGIMTVGKLHAGRRNADGPTSGRAKVTDTVSIIFHNLLRLTVIYERKTKHHSDLR